MAKPQSRLSKWWGGIPRTDPEGYECRIGALWTRVLIPRYWAITLAGKVWLGQPLAWRLYLRQDFWRAHEHHHVWQEAEVFRSTWRYLLAFAWQYVKYRSHRGAPLEKEADEAAARHVEMLARLKQETADEP